LVYVEGFFLLLRDTLNQEKITSANDEFDGAWTFSGIGQNSPKCS